MFLSGNAPEEGKLHRGWFMGHFMEGPNQRDDVEIKWGHHPQGDGDEQFNSQKEATSISLLLSGKIKYQFRKDGVIETIVVSKPGDYVMWEPGVGHTWEALEDSVSVTFRWPSLPDDVVKED